MFAQLGYYICIPFAWLTRLFYSVTGSYGVALILFTLVVKLVILPFQMKSKKSMLRINRMQGKIKDIQVRYANDKMRQQEEMRQDEAEERELIRSLRSHKEVGEKKQAPKKEGERYGKFNKFAAARKAAKEGRPWNEKMTDRRKLTAEEDRLLREALRKQDGKPLRKAALAQRIAANPKSAALRKTSRNNPINKARRAAKYNSRNDD